MHPEQLMTLPCTVTPRVVSVGDYGNDELTDGTSFDTVCFIWQNSHRRESTEDTGPENVLTDLYSAAFKPDDPIAANSKVTVQGVEFEVDGQSWPAFNPREQRVTHQEVSLRRVA